jgi:hypothetical protein
MATSHPKRAPSAADIEKALSGIQYPRTKEELINMHLDDRLAKILWTWSIPFQAAFIEIQQKLP